MSSRKSSQRSSKKVPAVTTSESIVAMSTPPAWTAWLAANHGSSRGVWLQIAKKGSGIPSVTYDQALLGALAWGWIDGQKRTHDANTWLQRFTPRGARSIWSKINCAKAEALIDAGEMHNPGLVQVDRAKRDGRWEAAYRSQSKSTVPDDLAAALTRNRRAAAFFETLDSANRYAVLFRVHTAKSPDTRARRLETFVAMLARHEKLHK